VPDLIAAHLRLWLEPWLAQQRLTLSDIGSWAIHPGGPRIVEATEVALGLPNGTAKVSRQVLNDYGNMSSATILFILKQLRDTHAPRPCVALGFGPGLAAEVMLWR
jgi:predicted naringenin-chalcone synthase